jgi:hypothetical protein
MIMLLMASLQSPALASGVVFDAKEKRCGGQNALKYFSGGAASRRATIG